MREGVGVDKSLRWVAARFAQRAIVDYFEVGRSREFVIDAAIAVEFSAKSVVANLDVRSLFDLEDAVQLSKSQLGVLNPALVPDNARPIGELRDLAFNALLTLKTISAPDAIRVASKSRPIDVAAADRLTRARNAALHLGDVNIAIIDRLAHDFLQVSKQLSSPSDPAGVDLWGGLAPIADVHHMTDARSLIRDANVRVVRARYVFHSLGQSGNRRGWLLPEGEGVQCPACGHDATISKAPAQFAPERYVAARSDDQPIEVLDCFVCGLTLFGSKQIKWAQHAFARARPAPPGPGDYLY